MSLDLTKYRLSNHERIAVGGSYTDTYLEVMANSNASSNTFGYVRWVPNNKSGEDAEYTDVYSNVASEYFDEWGYLQWTLQGTSNPWNLFRFSYHDDTNAYEGNNSSPGIRLVYHAQWPTTSLGLASLAAEIDNIHNDEYGDSIYVIVNNGRIASSTTFRNAMNDKCKSWRHVKVVGSSSTLSDRTFCGIGTNIGDIGFLAENIAGPGSNHSAAFAELVIEHDRSTIGHAGYGEDLSSGFGAGLYGITAASSYQLNWNTSGRFHVSPDENIRMTFETRMGQGSRHWGGNITVGLSEHSGPGPAVTSTSVITEITDGWAKHELLHAKTSSNNGTAYFNIQPDVGSGTGQGFDKLDIKNFQAFKCGYDPDKQRDQAVHKYHLNALDIEESPGPFRIGEPSEFYAFWNTDRNLADSTNVSYSLETTNSSTSNSPKRPINRQYQNGSNSSWGQQGEYNWPVWFDRHHSQTGNSQKWGWVHEVYSATINDTYDTAIGPNPGVDVDHTKMYMAGVWMRVRRSADTNTSLAPNRISLIGKTLNPGGYAESNYGTGSSTIAANTNYLQSIWSDKFDLTSDRQEWKLLNGFFLPSWMTAQERSDWKDDYWAKWSGHFEHGDGFTTSDAISGLTGYGLNTANAGYVCGMTTDTRKITPVVRVEQYQSTDIWCEFLYPFVIEMDPMNFTDDGAAWFWDFTENLPQ